MPASNLTKKALAYSVTKLLKDKPLDKITIKDITDDCGVTRNTFYYHFKDIYDLCSWIFISQAEEIMNRYKNEPSWEKGFLAGLSYLYENKKMIYHVYKSIRREDLEQYLRSVSEKYARELVDIRSRDLNVNEETKGLVAEFFKHAFVGKMMQWIEDDMDEEPERLAAICDAIFKGTVKEALLSVEKLTKN